MDYKQQREKIIGRGMSIKEIARDLYEAQQRVDRLEKKTKFVPHTERGSVVQELKIARKELEMLRKILHGEKESGDFRKKFSGFGNRA